MIEKVSELQNAAQANANKHHWVVQWNINESPPSETLHKMEIQSRILSIGDTIALCHSEVTEALEEYEKQNFEEFMKELADIAIRILHATGDLCIPIEAELCEYLDNTIYTDLPTLQSIAHEQLAYCEQEWFTNWNKDVVWANAEPRFHTIEETLMQINKQLSKALEAYRDDNVKLFATFLARTLAWTLYIAEELNQSLTLAINTKMLKNQNRAINHGRLNL